MRLDKIKELVLSKEYDFLRDNTHLGNNIILLGLGGSHAYGTEVETSDVDVRGIAVNSKREILLGRDFSHVVNEATDTTIYSLKKGVEYLKKCNPNTIEMLGLKPEHYIYLSKAGEILIENRKLFLSRRAIGSFGGYANNQLRRLDNKSARMVGQAEREQHVLNSINNAREMFPEKYFYHSDDAIRLYVGDSLSDEYEKEIFMDVNLTGYPLRDYKSMWSEMNNIVKDYSKIGRRNESAIERGKLGKHMMHTVRLYLMCFDILEKEEIITYRDTDHALLMDIRDGKFLDSERQPTKEFYEMVNELEKRLEKSKKETSLPDKPDDKGIDELVYEINERVVREREF